MKAVISATGLWTPNQSISNEEIVESFNSYVDKWNRENAAAIEAGERDPLTHSSTEFIEKGIRHQEPFCTQQGPNSRPGYDGAANPSPTE